LTRRITDRRLAASLVAAIAAAAALAPGVIAVGGASAQPSRGPRCVPAHLNVSAIVPGTNLAVSPLPGSYDASPATQISMLGAPASALSAITATGSQTGAHPGRLRAYSQGDGASFVPTKPFRPGEWVTVAGRVSGQQFSYRFAVALLDAIPIARSGVADRDPNEKLHFRSRPDLEPPSIVVTARSPQSAPGYVFATPYNGPGRSGPMIFDEAGNLVWFAPTSPGLQATNLQVQQVDGEPVLTWWQGLIPEQGFGQGEEIIVDRSYRTVAHVRAGNGLHVDLHDFRIEPRNDTALFTVFNPIACNLSPYGGPASSAVTDSIYQELDLGTGLVRREWHSLDHVPLADSYSSVSTSSWQWPFDYFHINSAQTASGVTLLSARNTWALYALNALTGQVATRIGGRHSDVQLPSGAATAFQHDAELRPNGTISIFDNGATPKIHPQSRGLIESVPAGGGTASVVAVYAHPAPLLSGSQGNLQLLPNGDEFIGWGSEPYFSEFSQSGQLLFDAHMHGSYQSYRAYRFAWEGAGYGRPALAVSAPRVGAAGAVYASWNGDTRTATLRVLGGSSARSLAPLATAPRNGFETALALPSTPAYVAVQALAANGAVLGTSPPVKG
jgi:Arylsulfotransferase (ASST)